MRSFIAIAASVAMLLAQMPLQPARAESAPPALQVASYNSVIAQTFQAYPNGGDALSKNITALILSNPKIAPDLIVYMRNAKDLSRAQKLAAEQGLAAAAETLRIKAADMGVPIVTKDTVVAPIMDDGWWAALAALAIGAALCIAECRNNTNNNVFFPPTVH
jgi:hypothetical protein